MFRTFRNNTFLKVDQKADLMKDQKTIYYLKLRTPVCFYFRGFVSKVCGFSYMAYRKCESYIFKKLRVCKSAGKLGC